MNLSAVSGYWARLFAGKHRSAKNHLLRQQRLLLRHGLVAHAEVMAVSLAYSVGTMHLINMYLRLKNAQDSFIHFHTEALVPLNSIPRKGECVCVKYFPDDFSSVLVM